MNRTFVSYLTGLAAICMAGFASIAMAQVPGEYRVIDGKVDP